ncbi:hypothetical protein [Streptomyces sp. NPDC006333]|uniref:hypothetical protein n=1 Tax=Streptomyces sp. NPDC006333 TaxID=3156753 RepID=UPI0033BB979E
MSKATDIVMDVCQFQLIHVLAGFEESQGDGVGSGGSFEVAAVLAHHAELVVKRGEILGSGGIGVQHGQSVVEEFLGPQVVAVHAVKSGKFASGMQEQLNSVRLVKVPCGEFRRLSELRRSVRGLTRRAVDKACHQEGVGLRKGPQAACQSGRTVDALSCAGVVAGVQRLEALGERLAQQCRACARYHLWFSYWCASTGAVDPVEGGCHVGRCVDV